MHSCSVNSQECVHPTITDKGCTPPTAYTNHTFSSDGRKKIYLSAYNPMKLGIELENIVDEKEIHMIQNVLSEIDKASKNKGEKEND